jgi:hypothetical protein
MAPPPAPLSLRCDLVAAEHVCFSRVVHGYKVNAMGDVYATLDGTPVDPDDWGWVNQAGRNDHAELRRSLESVVELPGFTVDETAIPRVAPGPKVRGSNLERPVEGNAPPAVVESKDGVDGTRANYNRLSDAVGAAVDRLLRRPDSSPMVVHDLVGGRRIRVSYTPTLQAGPGLGSVYVIEDGFGIKVGHTTGPVAKRIAGMQTGNPRPISVIAEIHGASTAVEAHLHNKLAQWSLTGEWFDRAKLMAMAVGHGGIEAWLRSLLDGDTRPITVHAPYR